MKARADGWLEVLSKRLLTLRSAVLVLLLHFVVNQ